MSKMKQIAALTAMLVGVIVYALPAKSAVCFLPDDDGNCGGGDIEISDGTEPTPAPEEKCDGFTISAAEYEKMKNCFSFFSCTKSKNKEVVYKQKFRKENTTWSNGICCTNGEKYFSKQGQCCPTTGCACSGGRVWNPSTEQCECPEGKEFVGGVCTCAGNTVPDSDGNCILPAGCTYEYRQATTEDSCGLRNFENTTKCMDTINGCMCYTQLQKVSSVYAGAGTVVPYNKISNKSATCVDDKGVTRYQTICQGTPKSKCSTNDGYEFKPNGCVSDTYNNGFEVKGDEWGDCVETKCTYEYVHLTKNDTGTDNYDKQRLRYGKDGEICTTEGSTREQTSSCIYSCSNGSCKCGSKYGPICSPAGSNCKIKQKCAIYRDCEHGTKCYNAIINNPSVTSGRLSGTPEWGTIYNKISNKSASCVANGVRKYETLCEGTIKEKCQGSQTFVPNGCVSDIYSDGGVYVAGANWGNCICSADKGFYDTAEECKKMTGKNCTYYNFCYQTCESRGFYSTKEACLNGKDSRLQCLENNGCYFRKAVGFTITQSSPNACGGWSFGLIDADGHYVNGNGIHEAGNYSVIIYREGSLIHYAGISSIQSGSGWCFGDQADDAGCEKTKSTGIGSSVSKAHSFQDGWDYTIYVSCL